MFHEQPKNRRMTPKERELELEVCKLFKRPPRDFIFDKPCYPYVPTDNKYMVNFDLNPPQ